MGADRFITNNKRDFPPTITGIQVAYPADLASRHRPDLVTGRPRLSCLSYERARVTYDTGALVGAERDDRQMWASHGPPS